MVHRLHEMTWPEVAQAVAAGAATVILPLGATEQHGPHLPLGTDTIRALALAERLAARVPGILVAPPLPLGCSDEHAGFPGLLSLDASTMAAVIVDCARRMAAWGARRLVLLSAHGGNDRALTLAAERLRHELPALRVWLPSALRGLSGEVVEVASQDGVRPEAIGLHAGEGETSEMLWLRPDLVRRECAAAGFIGDMEQVVLHLRVHGLRPVTPNGVLGDPTYAQARRGERYLNAQAAAIAADLEQL